MKKKHMHVIFGSIIKQKAMEIKRAVDEEEKRLPRGAAFVCFRLTLHLMI